jgi:DtxR family Mn-dependent transcriptional regulator
MDQSRVKEEFLETLWHLRERGQCSLAMFADLLREDFDKKILQELVADGLVLLDESAGTLDFTPAGKDHGRRLIRAHRLAERLIRDVLGGEAEQSACEFEHIVNPELIDGICTLLGHPRECPHGMAIPEGECCRRAATSAECPVVPLTQLDVGQKGRIAFVQCKSDEQMHRLEDLQLRPGVMLALHQSHPSIVVECEGSSIALDRDIAARIRVWRPADSTPSQTEPDGRQAGHGWFGRRRRGGRNGGGNQNR